MTERALIARRYQGSSVLITGGVGFIGTHLRQRLASWGAEVVVLGSVGVAGRGAPAGRCGAARWR